MLDRRKFIAALSGTVALTTVKVPAENVAYIADDVETRLASDPLRPQFHFLPAANWMNDPNGPIYWKGEYHMFCQYNPDGAYWGNMHWAHAVSTDMVHWKQRPVALSPTAGGPDATGCYTGTAVVFEDRVYMMYTGVRPAESQCLAVAQDPQLETWSKLSQPVIAAPPAGLQVNGFRDPSPWQQEAWWYTVLATGFPGRGGAVLLYRSRDLRSWEYMHVLAQREAGPAALVDPWEVWECPEFFALGDRHVLIYSVAGKTFWQSGKLNPETMTFHADEGGLTDYGTFYAAKTQLDKSGNRILWGWIGESRPVEEHKKAGWAGLMSLPRVLTLGEDGRLRIGIAPEVNQLREREQRLQLTADHEANQRALSGLELQDCCGEVLFTAGRSADPFALTIFGAEGPAQPWLSLKYDPAHRDQLLVDDHPVCLVLNPGQELQCSLHIDGSVIELLVNNQIAWTKRFYYVGPAQTMRLQWSGSTAPLTRFSLWQLSPISGDRLTT